MLSILNGFVFSILIILSLPLPISTVPVHVGTDITELFILTFVPIIPPLPSHQYIEVFRLCSP
jgi:hypothetical protein